MIEKKENFNALLSETRNTNSMNIDTISTLEMVGIINAEDNKVSLAVEKELSKIAQVIDMVADAFTAGGRLIYCGCGTAGRMGILDASECPPTFGVSPDMVVGLIAGGRKAIEKSVEGAEDSFILCQDDLVEIDFNSGDVLIGISASGRAPYVIGGLKYAIKIGASCVSLTCNTSSPMGVIADIDIVTSVGPEVLTGSTRMKSGTAQKMVLNMISTGAMIRIGKVYENLMVDVKPSNIKLIARSKRIIMEATGCNEQIAKETFKLANGKAKVAIVMLMQNMKYDEANIYLRENNDMIRSRQG